MTGRILSKFHFFLRDLVNIKILGVEIKSHTFFGYIIGVPLTLLLTFLMWKKWKKEFHLLTEFYISLFIGFILSLPFYLLMVYEIKKIVVKTRGME
jgi:ABC-type methionine transport system permease subunit